jgi:outer membrane murein-binding lipoprotein Lpp
MQSPHRDFVIGAAALMFAAMMLTACCTQGAYAQATGGQSDQVQQLQMKLSQMEQEMQELKQQISSIQQQPPQKPAAPSDYCP